MTRQAPEIYQKPIDDIDLTGLPPLGSDSFDQALITRDALEYASRGWAAIVTVDDQFIRVVAVPERGIEPKAYVLGLLKRHDPILSLMAGFQLASKRTPVNCLTHISAPPEAARPQSCSYHPK